MFLTILSKCLSPVNKGETPALGRGPHKELSVFFLFSPFSPRREAVAPDSAQDGKGENKGFGRAGAQRSSDQKNNQKADESDAGRSRRAEK
ncbi:hypothetical protein COV42_02825 [Candidatus Campbellbacteria bacterium CG11_big_fil_rev_8_21_14_0_20_44_21]|uniref:Uncharacterized protein n=1 Tax=Candidatus Campbellbacteria bacterium CG22_combo_CG10-13_8_21_14_all_43_18 TaxID=1974530 RepID=A0A2H0DXJ7_9BACT|nr:MAG: hypothetical protein COW82_02725 [Candidatus Campbellbacteria bacterium CG22_combo_CG10-13_8_21_14_all_43_18]PIR24046.1 MAG: hypothetical protein COV42_02825 [Candidatus Campbellbacteria bacterium CG11_big_fil_rev_8_21_14_0_20_44_21]